MRGRLHWKRYAASMALLAAFAGALQMLHPAAPQGSATSPVLAVSGDGTIRAEFSADSDGMLRAGSPVEIRNRRDDKLVWVPEGMVRGGIEMGYDTGVVAAVEGPSITYVSALPGVDESYTLEPRRLKHHYTLSAPPGGDVEFVGSLRLPPGFRAQPGGSFETSGEIRLIDGDGRTAFVIAAPVAFESADPDGTIALTHVVEPGDGGLRITLRAPGAWLDDPARRYPVVIDPTFESYETGGDFDAYVYNGQYLAQSFATDVGIDMDSAELLVTDLVGGPASNDDNITVELRNDNGGLPGATVLAGPISVNVEPDEPTFVWTTFTFGSPVAIYARTPYWIVARNANLNSNRGYQWRTDVTAGTYAKGDLAKSVNQGATWSLLPGYDAYFRANGTATPKSLLDADVSLAGQSSADVAVGSAKQAVIGIRLLVGGGTGALDLTELRTRLNLDDTADVTRVQAWWSSANDLSGATQFGADVTLIGSTTAELTFNGTRDLEPGPNWLWITMDIAPGATLGNQVTAYFEADTITVDGSPYKSVALGNAATRRTIEQDVGTIYYVAKTGSDPGVANNPAQPWLTIEGAFASLQSATGGDLTWRGPHVIRVIDSGVYDETTAADPDEGIWIRNLTTTADDTLTIEATARAVLDNGFEAKMITLDVDYVTVRGFVLRNAWGGICLGGGRHHLTIDDVRVTNGTNPIGDGIEVYDPGMVDANNVDFVTISNCVFYRTLLSAITQYADGIGATDGHDNWTIRNCVFYQCGFNAIDPLGRAGITLVGMNSGASIVNCTFHNVGKPSSPGGGNFDQTAVGISASCGDGAVLLKNNIFAFDASWDNGWAKFVTVDDSGDLAADGDYNLYYTDGIPGWKTEQSGLTTSFATWRSDTGMDEVAGSQLNPEFVDPTNGTWANRDYHLRSKYGYVRIDGTWARDAAVHSPAIDLGDPADAYTGEIEDNGNRVNLGAYGNTWQASKSGPADPPSQGTHAPLASNTWVGFVDGDWEDHGNWAHGIPTTVVGSYGTVIVDASDTAAVLDPNPVAASVSMTTLTSNAVADSFRLDSGTVAVNDDTYNLDVGAGGVDVNGGTLTLASGRTIFCAGSWDDAGGVFQPTGGTIRLDGTGVQSVNAGGGNNFFHLVMENAGARTATSALDVDGDFTLGGGSFAPAAFTHTVAGAWNDAGGTFTPAAGAVVLDGIVAQSLSAAATNYFFNLTVTQAGVATASSALWIRNLLSVDAGGTLELGNFAHRIGRPGAGGAVEIVDGELRSSGASTRLTTGGTPGADFYAFTVFTAGSLNVTDLDLEYLAASGVTMNEGATLDDGTPGRLSGVDFSNIESGASSTYVRFLATGGGPWSYTLLNCTFDDNQGGAGAPPPYNVSTEPGVTTAVITVAVDGASGTATPSSHENDHGAGQDDSATATDTIRWPWMVIVYTDTTETATAGSGVAIRMVVNGATPGTIKATDASGRTSFTSLAPGDRVLFYRDISDPLDTHVGDQPLGGVTVVPSPAGETRLYYDTLTLNHEDGGTLSNADLDAADGAGGDADVPYSAAGGAVTIRHSTNGAGTTMNLRVLGDYTTGNTVAWKTTAPASTGNLDLVSGTLTVDAAANRISCPGGFTMSGGTLRLDGGGDEGTRSTYHVQADGDVSITGGTYASNVQTGTVNCGGDFADAAGVKFYGILRMLNAGTVTVDANTRIRTYDVWTGTDAGVVTIESASATLRVERAVVHRGVMDVPTGEAMTIADIADAGFDTSEVLFRFANTATAKELQVSGGTLTTTKLQNNLGGATDTGTLDHSGGTIAITDTGAAAFGFASAGGFTLNLSGGTINLGGDIEINGNQTVTASGTHTFVMSGAVTQNIVHTVSAGTLRHMNVNKTDAADIVQLDATGGIGGTLTIARGVFLIPAGGSLTMGDGAAIATAAGAPGDATLRIAGAITTAGSDRFSMDVGADAVLDADSYSITRLDADGLVIHAGAVVAGIDNGTFDDVAPGGVYLDLSPTTAADRDNIPVSFNNLTFDGLGGRNVKAGLTTPTVLVTGGGALFGEAHDDDRGEAFGSGGRVHFDAAPIRRIADGAPFASIEQALADAGTVDGSRLRVLTRWPVNLEALNLAAAGDNVVIENGVFRPRAGLAVDNASERGTFRNCCFMRGGADFTRLENCVVFDPGAGVPATTNATAFNTVFEETPTLAGGTNNLTAQDGSIFQNAAQADFHLRSTAAAAIDAGTPLTLAEDFEGHARPIGAAWDIGADERVGDTPGAIAPTPDVESPVLGDISQYWSVFRGTSRYLYVTTRSTGGAYDNRLILLNRSTLAVAATFQSPFPIHGMTYATIDSTGADTEYRLFLLVDTDADSYADGILALIDTYTSMSGSAFTFTADFTNPAAAQTNGGAWYISNRIYVDRSFDVDGNKDDGGVTDAYVNRLPSDWVDGIWQEDTTSPYSHNDAYVGGQKLGNLIYRSIDGENTETPQPSLTQELRRWSKRIFVIRGNEMLKINADPLDYSDTGVTGDNRSYGKFCYSTSTAAGHPPYQWRAPATYLTGSARLFMPVHSDGTNNWLAARMTWGGNTPPASASLTGWSIGAGDNENLYGHNIKLNGAAANQNTFIHVGSSESNRVTAFRADLASSGSYWTTAAAGGEALESPITSAPIRPLPITSDYVFVGANDRIEKIRDDSSLAAGTPPNGDRGWAGAATDTDGNLTDGYGRISSNLDYITVGGVTRLFWGTERGFLGSFRVNINGAPASGDEFFDAGFPYALTNDEVVNVLIGFEGASGWSIIYITRNGRMMKFYMT